jgi:exopolyphosphatase/guanosine-5'-triphosphate,3'-diphosphate pyrophosphatase
MRCACIDIGSNTTRLLVADCAGPRLHEVDGERVFTALGAAVADDGAIPHAKIAEIADVVGAQAASARRHGAEALRVVGTAAVRRAPNVEELAGAIARVAGVALDVLEPQQEAELAFAGAVASLAPTQASVAVIDVGGGSTEVVVGTAAGGPSWWVSLPVGSSTLTRACVHSDPPSPACLASLRSAVEAQFAPLDVPAADLVLAVGGSATTLVLLGEEALTPSGLARSLQEIVAEPVSETALALAVHPERVRVLPAGIALLARAADTFGVPLRVVRAGLREGVVARLAAR